MTPSLIERLRLVDEVSLLELLEVTSTDIVDAFLDRIEENERKLEQALEDY